MALQSTLVATLLVVRSRLRSVPTCPHPPGPVGRTLHWGQDLFSAVEKRRWKSNGVGHAARWCGAATSQRRTRRRRPRHAHRARQLHRCEGRGAPGRKGPAPESAPLASGFAVFMACAGRESCALGRTACSILRAEMASCNSWDLWAYLAHPTAAWKTALPWMDEKDVRKRK